jgi:hypothetical protein
MDRESPTGSILCPKEETAVGIWHFDVNFTGDNSVNAATTISLSHLYLERLTKCSRQGWEHPGPVCFARPEPPASPICALADLRARDLAHVLCREKRNGLELLI